MIQIYHEMIPKCIGITELIVILDKKYTTTKILNAPSLYFVLRHSRQFQPNIGAQIPKIQTDFKIQNWKTSRTFLYQF